MMRRVLLESPYGSQDPKIIERNVRYARACMHDCLMRGEAPFASHLLYTQPGVLRDEIPDERERGINAGLAIGETMEISVIYTDLGMSRGMEYGIRNAEANGRPVEMRKLPPEALEKVLNST